jgi:alcohol dehydrogenase
MPSNLKELGVHDDRLEEMADKCTNSDTTKVGNFVKLGKSDVLNILILANK